MKLKQKIQFIIILKISVFLILGGFSFLPLVNSVYAAASQDQLNSLIKQKSQITSDINSKTKQAQAKSAQVTDLKKTITNLDNDISVAQSKIQSLNNQINQTESDINQTNLEIDQKQKELDDQKNKQNDAICLLYQSASRSTLESVIDSKSLSESIDRNQYIEALEIKIESTIETINKLKQDLENKRNDLNSKKNELSNLKSQQEAYKIGLDSQKNQKKIVLVDTQTQQKQLQDQIAQAQKMSSQVEAQIASIQANLSKNSSSGSRTVMARDRGTSSVGFQWPIDYNYISAYYGDRTPFQAFHTGIDLVNIPGTPVHAAASGTVITSTDMKTNSQYYGYGKYVVIGHNARYSSLYGHFMAVTVSTGDEVKAGDVIGYLGNTGWSTGPHLHLEIWEYGNRNNPLTFLP